MRKGCRLIFFLAFFFASAEWCPVDDSGPPGGCGVPLPLPCGRGVACGDALDRFGPAEGVDPLTTCEPARERDCKGVPGLRTVVPVPARRLVLLTCRDGTFGAVVEDSQVVMSIAGPPSCGGFVFFAVELMLIGEQPKTATKKAHRFKENEK